MAERILLVNHRYGKNGAKKKNADHVRLFGDAGENRFTFATALLQMDQEKKKQCGKKNATRASRNQFERRCDKNASLGPNSRHRVHKKNREDVVIIFHRAFLFSPSSRVHNLGLSRFVFQERKKIYTNGRGR